VWDTLISDILDPATACITIGVCDVGGVVSDVVDCKMCKQATKVVAKHLEDPKVEEQIAEELISMCDKVFNESSTVDAKCKAAVSEDTPKFMKQVGEELKLHFCDEAKICP